MIELFNTTGYRVIEAVPRVLQPSADVSSAIKLMATAAAGAADPEIAVLDSWPVQWVMRATHV